MAALIVMLAVLLLSVTPSVMSIENKCGACVAIAKELLEVLAEERPRNHLDMRNRLNSQGVREGKVIDYKVSELRAVEILDSLCGRVENYAIDTKDDRRVWRKPQKGVYKFNQAKLIQEEQGKEIKRWCHKLVEEEEEQLEALLRSGELNVNADVPSVLCLNVTSSCKHKALQREVLGDSEEAAAAAAAAAATGSTSDTPSGSEDEGTSVDLPSEGSASTDDANKVDADEL